MKRIYLFILILFSCAVFAQDSVYFRQNAEVRVGQVTHITKRFIVFRTDSSGTLVTDTIHNSDLNKVVLSTAAQIQLSENYFTRHNNVYSMRNRRNAFKMDVPMLVPNKLSIGYERWLFSHFTLDVSAGWTDNRLNITNVKGKGNADNLWTDDKNTQKGYVVYGNYFTAGIKYIYNRGKFNTAKRLYHNLTGAYLEYEVNYANLNVEQKGYYTYYTPSGGFGNDYIEKDFSEKYKELCVAHIVNIGYQCVMSDGFLIDVYGGFGLATVNRKLISNTLPQENYFINDLEYGYYNSSWVQMHSYISFKDVSATPLLQLGVRVGFTAGKKRTVYISAGK